MSCSTFNLKSCSQTELICIFTESVTLSKQIVTSGTQVHDGIKEWACSFRWSSSQRWLHSTRTVLYYRATSINSVCDPMCKQRSSSDAKASVPTAVSTVILKNIGMHCDHIDKKLCVQLTQQFLHHRIHLKHQMTSKRLKTNKLVLKFTASLFQSSRPFCVTNSYSR